LIAPTPAAVVQASHRRCRRPPAQRGGWRMGRRSLSFKSAGNAGAVWQPRSRNSCGPCSGRPFPGLAPQGAKGQTKGFRTWTTRSLEQVKLF